MEESGEMPEASADDAGTAMAVDSTASKAASTAISSDGSREASSIHKAVLAFLVDTAWRAGQGWHAPQVTKTSDEATSSPCRHHLPFQSGPLPNTASNAHDDQPNLSAHV